LPTIKSAEGIVYTPSNLIEVYPETVTDEMFDYYGYILPQYLQKRAYASTENGAMTYFDITNNAEYFSNLSNLPPISNVAQSNNKKNSTFMIPSINVDNNNFDILVDTPNYKVFRGENGSIRIAITQNGI
jgi:hypothetical protein